MRLTTGVLSVLSAAAIAACDNSHPQPQSETSDVSTKVTDKPQLGLMTSLPLYWSLDADFGDLASGAGEVPWQRSLLESDHELVLLDTLSPIPGLTSDAPETDPLAGLDRLAVIQPRGLSPSDNVALDDWVRGGGELLLVLDPLLTGEYDLALGDPRRPTDAALIPAVVARWGMEVHFDDKQERYRQVPFDGSGLAVSLAGQIVHRTDQGAAVQCTITEGGVAAQCDLGDGRVTLITDAFAFEMPIEPADAQPPENSELLRVIRFAFGA